MSALFFDKAVTFSGLPIDRRLFKAAARQRLVYPSVIQSKVLPIALQGRDIIVSARTGAGKTLAYVLPMLQLLLTAKDSAAAASPSLSSSAAVRALIVVPTRELAHQVRDVCQQMSFYCSELITHAVITADSRRETQLPVLMQRPDVLIATPGRLREHVDAGAVDVSSVSLWVLDEADLLLSFDYSDDVTALHRSLSSHAHQTLLLSATMPAELSELSSLLLSQPVTVALDAGASSSGSAATLSEYYCQCSGADRYLLLYCFLKLRLVRGRCLFFCKDAESGFRLKLFLQQFSISSGVIDDQLPFNSRMAVLQQFNRGSFDFLIASDRSVDDFSTAQQQQKEAGKSGAVVKVEDEHDLTAVKDEQEKKETAEAAETAQGRKKKRKAAEVSLLNDDEEVEDVTAVKQEEEDEAATAEESKDASSSAATTSRRRPGRGVKREYGLSRGIDFVDVSAVINVDFPSSVRSYIHRVGRTARAGKAGMAVSLVTPADAGLLEALLRHQVEQAAQTSLSPSASLRPLPLPVADIEAFRYRVEDVSRAVTTALVRSTRQAELKRELMSSSRMQGWWEDRPAEAAVLRADRGVRAGRLQPHLAHVPSYLLPQGVTEAELGGGEEGTMGRTEGRTARGRRPAGDRRRAPRGRKRDGSDDPVKTAGKSRDVGLSRSKQQSEAQPSKKRKRTADI